MLNKWIFNLIYPVGSYYETSNVDFDPNNFFAGTWKEDTAGRVTVAYQSNNTSFNNVGKIGGETVHTLTVNEMPKHGHGYTWMSSSNNAGNNWSAAGGMHPGIQFGTTESGGSQPHNNLQPYVVVKRWHRIS